MPRCTACTRTRPSASFTTKSDTACRSALPTPNPSPCVAVAFWRWRSLPPSPKSGRQWTITPAREYLRDPVLRLGATPDFYIRDERGRRGVLQAKTVSKFVFDKQWGDAPPPYIRLAKRRREHARRRRLRLIAALIVDGYHFDCRLFDVPRHKAAEERIRETVASFWRAVGAGTPPKLDYERDGALIAAMYPVEVAGKVADLRTDNRLPELLAEHERLKAAAKDADAARETIAAEIKAKVGDAESALVADGWLVTLKTQHRKAYTVAATSYRRLLSSRRNKTPLRNRRRQENGGRD